MKSWFSLGGVFRKVANAAGQRGNWLRPNRRIRFVGTQASNDSAGLHECERTAFRWFLASTLFSAVARNGYLFACAWILVSTGGGSASVAVFFAIISVTEIVASPIAGWIADRWNRCSLYMIADGVRFSAIVLLGIMPDAADLNWTIWISAIVFAICDRVALTSAQSMIPVVAAHVSLPSANSIVFFLMQAGSLVAATLIGIFLYSLTPKATFIVLAIGFSVSACLMWPLRRVYRNLRLERPEASQKWPFNAQLGGIAGIYALLYTGGVLVSVIGPSFVLTELAGSAIDFGHLETAWSAGTILGALILIRRTQGVKLQALLIAVVAMTACAFALLKAMVLPWSLAVIVVLGTLYNLGRVAIEVTLQLSVPSNALGRAKGVIHSFAVLLGILLFASIAICGDEVQPSSFFVAYSIVLAAGAVAIGAWRLITAR